MKKCSKCNIEKELILFGLSSRNKDKKRSQCKECDALYRNSLNENKNIEYRKEYYKNNKEKLLLNNKEYRLKNTVDSLQIDIDNLQLRNAILVEESQTWKQKFSELQKLYDKLKEEFETYRKKHKL